MIFRHDYCKDYDNDNYYQETMTLDVPEDFIEDLFIEEVLNGYYRDKTPEEKQLIKEVIQKVNMQTNYTMLDEWAKENRRDICNEYVAANR